MVVAAPLIASLWYFGIVFVICQIGRRVARSVTQSHQQLIFFHEFFGTLQFCAMAYENGLIIKHYGLIGFFVAIACQILLHTMTLGEAFANPCPIFEETTLFSYRRRSKRFQDLLIRLAAQLAAGVVSYRLAKLVWGLGFMPDHSSLADKYPCTSDLHVPLLNGFIFEMVATFLVRLVWLKGHENYRNWPILLDALFVPSVVVFGLATTGMYLNPILAFSMNYGCKGVTPIEHLLVYWLGPTLGWMLATEVNERTKWR